MLPSESQPYQRTAWISAWIYFVVVLLAYSCVLLLAQGPPFFVDYPDWVYQGHLFHGVLTGHPVPGYLLKPYPIPNSTSTVGLGVLDLLMPWAWAAKVWLVLYLALAAVSTWAAIYALRLRHWQLVVALPSVLFLNIEFWWGHINFEIGLCLFLLMLALLVRGTSTVWISALLVVLFFTHMEACSAALLLLLLWSFTEKSWRKLWAALPILLLVAWYAVGRYTHGDVDSRRLPEGDYHYGTPTFFLYKLNTIFKFFGYVNVVDKQGFSVSENLLGRGFMITLIALALVLACLCIRQMAATCRKRFADVPRQALARFTACLFVIAVLLPQVMLGVSDPGSRLLIFAAATGFLIMPWRGRIGTSIALISALLCLVNLGQLAKVGQNPRQPGHARDTPTILINFGHATSDGWLEDYDAIDRPWEHLLVFPTALFIEAPTSTTSPAFPIPAPDQRK